MSHEQFRPHPNQYLKHYAGRLASLAVNTAQVIHHEVCPPKPEAPVVPESELAILDDENAVIRVRDEQL